MLLYLVKYEPDYLIDALQYAIELRELDERARGFTSDSIALANYRHVLEKVEQAKEEENHGR